MQLFAGTVLLALLLAGATRGSDIESTILEKGHFVEITVVTVTQTVLKCYLVTPSNDEIDLLAQDALSEKYEYLINAISNCRVRINDLDKNDEGLWSLHSVLLSADDLTTSPYEQVKVLIKESESSDENLSQNVSEDSEETADSEVNSSKSTEETVDSEVISSQSSEETVDSEVISHKSSEETVDSEAISSENSKLSAEDVGDSEENENVLSSENSHAVSQEAESSEASNSEEEIVEEEWLSDLQFVTRTGLNVDINLPRTVNTETCSLTKPDGTTVDVGAGIPGVTAHGSSDYVSCRVVVGPMDAELLGRWTLCGSHEADNVKHRRCQHADIVWRSTSSPDSMWQTTINPQFEHVVHFGGTLTPAVRGSGAVAACHLVTPGGEDLVVARQREYPGVLLVQASDSTCSVAVGPIAAEHLGDWTVYGTFTSSVWGYNEVRLPFNMELYNKDDPYDRAYNVTTLTPVQHVVNLGSTIPVAVSGAGAVDACQVTPPWGGAFGAGAPAGVAFDAGSCRLSVGPITEDMLGEWLLVGKFSNRDIYTENRLTFTIIREDPSNPIEEDRTVQYLDEEFLDTDIGASHRIVIPSDIFATFQSCHIRTPAGLQYTIMEGFDLPGVEVEGSGACGVAVRVSEALVGTWTLMAREIRSSQAVERRLPFSIYVEESVEAVPNEITITEGNSIHVRLADPTALYSTCKLLGPDGEESPLASPEAALAEACGFAVASVDASHAGTWHIVYGTNIIYKAPVVVNVNAREEPVELYVSWVEHTSVNQTIGPEDAVYCQVVSPGGDVVSDGFGRCRVVVDRVEEQHHGTWKLVVALPGRILTENHLFAVDVVAADKKPEVSTSVLVNKPTVELGCSVTSPQQTSACLFRAPAGAALLAGAGVREGRYLFHVNQTRLESGSYYYSCSVEITEPTTSDLGLWRCDLQAEGETYYGFLAALCPWALQDPAVAAAVVTEPVLTAHSEAARAAEGAPALLTCSARAPLRYCYFRAPNGTVFNVGPGTSSGQAQYWGAGLDAGECGVRVARAQPADAGAWACHAGIQGEEQAQRISLFVQEEFVVSSRRDGSRLVLEARVGGARALALDYCRFVRFDGFGFSSDNTPLPYEDSSSLSSGVCRLAVAPAARDLRPWTLAAKLRGRHGELARVVGLDWLQPAPVYYNSLFMWLPLLLIFSGCLLVGAALCPEKHRRWAGARASAVRGSLRRWSAPRKPALPHTNPAA